MGARYPIQQHLDPHIVYPIEATLPTQQTWHILCTELELGTQYNNSVIHILPTAWEIGIQYNNPEIHILSTAMELGNQYNNS